MESSNQFIPLSRNTVAETVWHNLLGPGLFGTREKKRVLVEVRGIDKHEEAAAQCRALSQPL